MVQQVRSRAAPRVMKTDAHNLQDNYINSNVSSKGLYSTTQPESPVDGDALACYPASSLPISDSVYTTPPGGSESSPSQSAISVDSEHPTQLSELFTPTVQKAYTGIPMSNSWQSIPTLSILVSPEVTPQKDSVDFADVQRPIQLTEPRNFAPRTAGPTVAREPPPKFDLPRMPPRAPRDQASDDAFVDSLTSLGLQRHSESIAKTVENAVVPFQHAQPEQQQQAVVSYAPEYQPSLPSLRTALSEEHFPFTDSARLSRPKNNGVIRLKNVSIYPDAGNP